MRIQLGAVAAIGLSAALLTACGNSAGSAGDPGTVTVGVSAPNLNLLPLWLADQKGYYKQAGLTVKIAKLTPATTNTALNSGSVQFLDGSPNNFLTAVSQGTGQIAVMQTALGIPLGVAVSKKFAARHGLSARSPAKTVARAMVGSTGGSASDATTGQAALFLRENAVRIGQVKMATLANPDAYVTALRNGQIDWFSTSEPIPQQAQAQGAGIVVATPKNVAAWSPDKIGIGSAMLTSKRYANANAATVTKFVQATARALTYIRAHKDADDVTGVAAGQLPGVPRAILKDTIADIDWSDGAMSAPLWATSARFIKQLGVVSPDTAVTQDDWTNKYLK